MMSDDELDGELAGLGVPDSARPVADAAEILALARAQERPGASRPMLMGAMAASLLVGFVAGAAAMGLAWRAQDEGGAGTAAPAELPGPPQAVAPLAAGTAAPASAEAAASGPAVATAAPAVPAPTAREGRAPSAARVRPRRGAWSTQEASRQPVDSEPFPFATPAPDPLHEPEAPAPVPEAALAIVPEVEVDDAVVETSETSGSWRALAEAGLAFGPGGPDLPPAGPGLVAAAGVAYTATDTALAPEFQGRLALVGAPEAPLAVTPDVSAGLGVRLGKVTTSLAWRLGLRVPTAGTEVATLTTGPVAAVEVGAADRVRVRGELAVQDVPAWVGERGLHPATSLLFGAVIPLGKK